MKYNDVIKKIEKYSWWSEECPAVAQIFAYPIQAFITQSNTLHPKYLSIAMYVFVGRFIYERTPIEEKYEVYKYMFEQMKKDRGYRKKLIELTRERGKKYQPIGDDFGQREPSAKRGAFYQYYR